MADKNTDTLLAQAPGWTPIHDCLVTELGLIPAALFAVIRRFEQQRDGVCHASLETISKRIGIGRRTVIRHIKALQDAGYIRDTTPGRRNRPHAYVTQQHERIIALSQKAQKERKAQKEQADEGVPESHPSVPESPEGVPESPDRCARKSLEDTNHHTIKTLSSSPPENPAEKDRQTGNVNQDDDFAESNQHPELDSIMAEIERIIMKKLSNKDKSKLAQSLENPTDALISLLDELTDEPASKERLANRRRWCARIAPQPEPLVATAPDKALAQAQDMLAKHRAEPLSAADTERLRDAIRAVADADYLTLDNIRSGLPRAEHYKARRLSYVLDCARTARDAENRQPFGKAQKTKDQAVRAAGAWRGW